jgi:RND family efflux transporter MFP subunit
MKHLQLLAVCAAGLAICTLILITGPEPLEASVPEGKPQVEIGALSRTATASTITSYGALNPRQSLNLTTQVPGEIIWVSERLVAGSQVDAGELLFRIDDRDYAIAVARAQAGLAQAQATVDLEEGQAEIAEKEWASWQKQNDWQRDASARPLALREPQQAQVAAQLDTARAELQRVQLALARTSIEAPWPATVISANAVVGRLLPAGEVTATLFPLDYAVVEVQVPIENLGLIETGIERVELRPAHDLDADPVTGTFESVVRNLTSDTRLATVRVRVWNPLSNPGWAFGMHLEATLVATSQRAIALLPADLIVSGNMIWVYRDGQARRHQIFPIDSSELTVSVDDNFDAGDALILERPIGLFDGADVEAVSS